MKSIQKQLFKTVLLLLAINFSHISAQDYGNLGEEISREEAYKDKVLATDLHDTVLQRNYGIARRALFNTSFMNFMRFMSGAVNYGIDKKIRKKQVPSIEHYLLARHNTPEYEDLVTDTVSCFEPTPDAEKWLENLNDNGVNVYAFSNIGPRSYEKLAKKHPEIFDKFKSRVILETPETTRKKYSGAYTRCANEISKDLGHEPKEIVFLDDSHDNLNLAKETDPRFRPVHFDKKNIQKSHQEVNDLLLK